MNIATEIRQLYVIEKFFNEKEIHFKNIIYKYHDFGVIVLAVY